MKKLFIITFTFFTLFAISQPQTSKIYKLSTITDKAGISILSLRDGYLSPLNYSGVGIFYQRTSQKLFSEKNTRLSMETKIRFLMGLTLNPEISAETDYAGGSASWGTYYHFKIDNDIKIRAGGFLDGIFAMKENSRNINNPYNFDVATNLNASAEIKYPFTLFKKKIIAIGNVEFPFMGCMFVPQGGISYYQLLELKDFNNSVHFSSLHNRQGFVFDTAIEIPFKHSEWKFGIGADATTWKANNLYFRQSELKLSLAIKYDIYRFSGLKNKAPENFSGVE